VPSEVRIFGDRQILHVKAKRYEFEFQIAERDFSTQPLLRFGLNLCAVMIHIKPREGYD
jgi:hypothetical protein